MAISTDAIKELRERSGAGIMDCKRALEQADGDLERALVLLREMGLSTAMKKVCRYITSTRLMLTSGVLKQKPM